MKTLTSKPNKVPCKRPQILKKILKMAQILWTELVEKIYTSISKAIEEHEHFFDWKHLPLNCANSLQFALAANEIFFRMRRLAI